MRDVLNDELRRMMPQTLYPLASSSSVRYEPSWPVMPVIRAVLPLRGGCGMGRSDGIGVGEW